MESTIASCSNPNYRYHFQDIGYLGRCQMCGYENPFKEKPDEMSIAHNAMEDKLVDELNKNE